MPSRTREDRILFSIVILLIGKSGGDGNVDGGEDGEGGT